MDIKKIFRSGNSLVVTIGAEGREWMKLKEGDQVMIQCGEGPILIVKKVTEALTVIAEKGTKRHG